MKSTILLLLAAGSLVLAGSPYHIYTHEEYAYMACTKAVETTANLCKAAKNAVMPCMCTSVPLLGSTLACLHANGYYSPKMEAYLAALCQEGYPQPLDASFFDTVYQNASLFLITPDANFNKTKPSYTPVTVSATKVKTNYRAYYNRWNNFTQSLNLGAGLYGLMVLIMVVAAIGNWSLVIFPGFAQSFNGTSSKWFRAKVSLAALSHKRNAPLRFWGIPVALLPTRLESLAVLLLWLYMILASSLGYEHLSNNPIWKTRAGEIGRLVADRTGMMALFAYPLSMLFATRNNIFTALTRWNFARFNIFHRHFSRMFFWLSFTHAVAMTVQSYALNKYALRMARGGVIWGVVSTVAMGIIMVQALLFLRRKSYEVFLVGHIVLAVFVLIGVHYHVDEYNYGGFSYSVAGLWILDRLIRLVRIARFGVQTALVTLVAGETLRVVIPKPTHWTTKPGQYAFISFLTPLQFWQSHPFTVIAQSETCLTMAIKIKGGMTSSIYKKLVTLPGQAAEMRVVVEGPYGVAAPASRYAQTLLVASGHGIPGLYDHAIRLSTPGSARSVKLVWIIRNLKSMEWMAEEMQKLGDTGVHTVVYVTQPNAEREVFVSESDDTHESKPSKEVFKGTKEPKEYTNVSSDKQEPKEHTKTIFETALCRQMYPHIEFHQGRPDFELLLRHEFTDAAGSMAIVTCGHDSMADAVRHAVVQNLDCASHRVDYFEDLQVWA